MAKKKEIQEELEELEETESLAEDMDEDDDWDEEDDNFEVNDDYEEALRLEKEERRKAKNKAMELAFKRDTTIEIRKNYNFLLGYGTFVRILSIVGAAIVALAYIILVFLSGEVVLLIPAAVVALLLILGGYLTETFLKWLAYVLKMLYEINQKLK